MQRNILKIKRVPFSRRTLFAYVIFVYISGLKQVGLFSRRNIYHVLIFKKRETLLTTTILKQLFNTLEVPFSRRRLTKNENSIFGLQR